MSTLFEQPSSNSFNINNRGGGIKRMKKSEGPTNFYQQIEFNAERLLLNFPSKDKLQLMKLLESVDNEIEVANEILNQEINYSNNNSNINSAFKNQSDYEMGQLNQYNNNNNNVQLNQNKLQYQMNGDKQAPLKERKILTNLKLKSVKNDRLGGQNQISKNLQNQSISQVQNGNTMMSQSCIQIEENMNDRSNLPSLKQQISYGMPTSSEQLESKISQEITNNLDDQIIYSNQQKQLQQQQQKQINNSNNNNKNTNNRIGDDQNQDSNDDEDQQSATQDDDSQPQQQQMQLNMRQQQNQQQQQSVRFSANQGSIISQPQQQQQQQQGVNNPRLKDMSQISQFQKSLVEEIIPQLLQKLGNSDIQQAPDILMQAFKYYEEQSRKAIQYDKIIQNHEILLKAFSNIYKNNQVLTNKNIELNTKNQELTQERDKYLNISERLAIMFKNNNEQQPSFHHVNYFDKGGSSGMCF